MSFNVPNISLHTTFKNIPNIFGNIDFSFPLMSLQRTMNGSIHGPERTIACHQCLDRTCHKFSSRMPKYFWESVFPSFNSNIPML